MASPQPRRTREKAEKAESVPLSKRGVHGLRTALGRVEGGVGVIGFKSTDTKRGGINPPDVVVVSGSKFARSHENQFESRYVVLDASLFVAFEKGLASSKKGKSAGADRAARIVMQVVESLTSQTEPHPVLEESREERWHVLRTEFLREHKSVTAPQLARLTGSEAANPSARAYAWKRAGKIFSVNDGTGERFPLFQLKDGQPREVIAEVLATLGRKLSPWELAIWFTTPHADLGSWKRPVDLLDRNPTAVATAANSDAEEVVY